MYPQCILEPLRIHVSHMYPACIPHVSRMYPTCKMLDETMIDPRDFGFLVTLMFRRLGGIPEEHMRLIWHAYLELYAQMLTDRLTTVIATLEIYCTCPAVRSLAGGRPDVGTGTRPVSIVPYTLLVSFDFLRQMRAA
jgi:hypothetical protein